MDGVNKAAVERITKAAHEANGQEVEEFKVQQKGKDAYLVTLKLSGRDEERQMVVTRSEVEE